MRNSSISGFLILVAIVSACGRSTEDIGASECMAQDSIMVSAEIREIEQLNLKLDSMNSIKEGALFQMSIDQQLDAYMRFVRIFESCHFSEIGCKQKMELKIQGTAFTNVKVMVSDVVYRLNQKGEMKQDIIMPSDSLCMIVVVIGEEPETEIKGTCKVNGKTKDFAFEIDSFAKSHKMIIARSYFEIKDCNSVKTDNHEAIVKQ